MFTVTPEKFIEIRKAIQKEYGLGITKAQTYCAELICKKIRTWQKYETGNHPIDHTSWQLLNLKLDSDLSPLIKQKIKQNNW